MPENVVFKTTTIADGNMSFRFGEADKVVRNRRRFLEKIGGDYTNTVCMACNHGEIITAINRSNYDNYFGVNAQEKMLKSEVLVTNEPGLALMVLTADCLPTLIFDPVQQVIALAHLNRYTIAHDLGQKTVGFLAEHYGSNPTDLIVKIGPHISAASYAFPAPLRQLPPRQLTPFSIENDGHVHIDLPAAEIAQLNAAQVPTENISVSNIDTATSPEHFSHYRSRRDAAHPAGRLATVAWIDV